MVREVDSDDLRELVGADERAVGRRRALDLDDDGGGAIARPGEFGGHRACDVGGIARARDVDGAHAVVVGGARGAPGVHVLRRPRIGVRDGVGPGVLVGRDLDAVPGDGGGGVGLGRDPGELDLVRAVGAGGEVRRSVRRGGLRSNLDRQARACGERVAVVVARRCGQGAERRGDCRGGSRRSREGDGVALHSAREHGDVGRALPVHFSVGEDDGDAQVERCADRDDDLDGARADLLQLDREREWCAGVVLHSEVVKACESSQQAVGQLRQLVVVERDLFDAPKSGEYVRVQRR